MFKSQELWDLLENKFEDMNLAKPDQRFQKTQSKDAKALFLIQQALDEDIFSKIRAASTFTQTWEILN